MTVRVLVVDDHEVLRQGLVTVLTSDDQVEVVGQAGDGPEAVRAAHRLRPDVVLMDVEMAGGDGIAATREITASLPDTRVLVLTMFDWTSTSWRRCAPGPAATCSRRRGPPICSRP